MIVNVSYIPGASITKIVLLFPINIRLNAWELCYTDKIKLCFSALVLRQIMPSLEILRSTCGFAKNCGNATSQFSGAIYIRPVYSRI
jgi:hypothetical protein